MAKCARLNRASLHQDRYRAVAAPQVRNNATSQRQLTTICRVYSLKDSEQSLVASHDEPFAW
ncbi:Uncharacterised protein [Vibrio cholerae]|nr:Uncharacterised protein [Vibrio cholerae]